MSALIYPINESPLFQPFLDLATWQWICGLVQDDIANVHEELIPISRSVRTTTAASRGGSSRRRCSGSSRIRASRASGPGDILALVQAKRYALHNKINPGPVAALHSVADVENAQRTIFVTTSDFDADMGSRLRAV